MGKKQFERDISGMKLFGRCKFYGNCVCGRCANAPVNRQVPMTVIKPGEDPQTIMVPESYNGPEFSNFGGGVQPGTSQIDKFNRRAAAAHQKPAAPAPVNPHPRMPHTPFNLQKRKRCPDCNVLLRKDHKCKFGLGQNGPVVKRDPLPKAAVIHCPECGEGLETLTGHVCYQSIETMEDTRVPGGRVNLANEAAQLPGGEPITDKPQPPAPDPDAIPLPAPQSQQESEAAADTLVEQITLRNPRPSTHRRPGIPIPRKLYDLVDKEIVEQCRNGHDRTPENTFKRPDGRRECKICKREYQRRGRTAPTPSSTVNVDGRHEIVIALPGIEITIRPIRPGATRV